MSSSSLNPWESPARRAAAARAVPSVYSPYRRWSSAPSSDGTFILCDTSEHPKCRSNSRGAASSLERPRGGVASPGPCGRPEHASIGDQGLPRPASRRGDTCGSPKDKHRGRYKSSRLRSVIDFIEPISSGVRRTGIAHLPEPAGRKHCRVWLAPLFIKGRSDSAEPVDSILWVGLRTESRKRGNSMEPR